MAVSFISCNALLRAKSDFYVGSGRKGPVLVCMGGPLSSGVGVVFARAMEMPKRMLLSGSKNLVLCTTFAIFIPR